MKRALPWVLALIPPVFLAGMIAQYGFDAPYQDTWEFVRTIEKSYDGTLTLRDIWEQQNEHRLIIPKAIMLFWVHLTRWNEAYEWATTFFFALCFYVVVLLHVRSILRRANVDDRAWTAPLLSLVVFSLSQWQIWLWGWHLLIYLNLLMIASAAVLLAHPSCSWPRLFSACGAITVATYSYANGAAFWPIGLLLLLWVRPKDPRRAAARVVVWIACAAVAMGAYLYGYATPSYTPSPTRALDLPWPWVQYALAYLGAPLSNLSDLFAVFVGLFGIALLAWGVRNVQRAGLLRARDFAGLAGWVAYALSSDFITATARVTFGREQAISSRYIAFGNLFWISVIAVLAVLALGKSRGVSSLRRFIAWSGIGITFVLLLVSHAYGSYSADERHDAFQPARDAIIEGTDDAMLQRLHPNLDLVKQYRQILLKHRLSVFRETLPSSPATQSASSESP